MRKRDRIAILKGMHSRLSRPGGWVQGAFRRPRVDKNGKHFVAFCLAGAAQDAAYERGIYRPVGDGNIVRELGIDALALAKLAETSPRKAALHDDGYAGSPTMGYNDYSRTRKRDIIALVNEALAKEGVV